MDWILRLLEIVESSGPAQAVRGGVWIYPLVEVAHIAGLAMLVGAASVFDLRLLGLGSRVPVADLARQVLPWAWVGFSVAALTGSLMFSANATALPYNPAFQLKLLLIALAGVNVAAFHVGPFRSAKAWGNRPGPPAAKVAALVSMTLWLAIIACGRLIAYV